MIAKHEVVKVKGEGVGPRAQKHADGALRCQLLKVEEGGEPLDDVGESLWKGDSLGRGERPKG